VYNCSLLTVVLFRLMLNYWIDQHNEMVLPKLPISMA